MGCSLNSKKEKGIGFSERCIKCNKPAKVLLAYGPQEFCETHFMQLIESRFKKTVRQNSMIARNEKIVVAVSGGKDSLTALHLINTFFSKYNEINALLIDEGIDGYRDRALKIAAKNCRQLGVQFKRKSFKQEYGLKMEQIYKKMQKSKKNLGSPCAFCGTIRRNIMNKYAKKMNADKLVTGHNLDDELQSLLMNAFDNNQQRFLGSGPLSGIGRSRAFVKKIKPLCSIPENEVMLYTHYAGIEHYSGKCCPFKNEAKRNHYRQLLEETENNYPGSKFSLWNFYNGIKPLLLKEWNQGELPLKECKKCGEPSKNSECDSCRKIKNMQG